MRRRFFVRGRILAGRRRLDGAEAHHLVRVLRIGVGDYVVLFNGEDLEAAAEVLTIEDSCVDLLVGDPRVSTAEASVELVLATAVPKGDRFSWLVEKGVELGVRRMIPLLTQRSVVDPGAGKLEKMRRTIIEASKQCRRSRLMELDAPIPWAQFLEKELTSAVVWIADPSGIPLGETPIPQTGRVIAAIGPEGGFTDKELEAATKRGAVLISLGPRVLRVETAALAIAAILSLH